VQELLWFLNGDSNIQYLCQNGVRIWDDWPFATYTKQAAEYARERILKAFAQRICYMMMPLRGNGASLGPVYGYAMAQLAHRR
jgi:thymidylate synthase